MRDFVKYNFIDMLCIPETWLDDDNSAIICAQTSEPHILHHVPGRDKNGGGVGYLITISLNLKNNIQQISCHSSV